ncbi:hypothetical protein QZH41_014509 [Actinostola sp. cb2023]|nr:hypothetical protein QZH41_014509 [Actinostola sp. cb2023]
MEVGGQRIEVEGQRMEVGGQRIEVGGQRMEVGGQRMKVGGQRIEVEGQRMEVEGQRMKVEGQRMKVGGQRIEVEGQRMEVEGQRMEVGGQRIEVEGQRMEVEGQRMEVEGQRMEVGGQRMKVGGQRIEVEGQRMEVEGQRMKVGGQRIEVEGQRMEVGGQRMEVGGQRTEVEGQRMEVEGQRMEVGEIWSSNNILKSIDIKAADKHGDICEDSQFSSLQWSPSERRLVYVAEKKREKCLSYFETNDQDESSPKSQPKKGSEFDYEGSWGEQLAKRHHPVLAVLDIATGDISVIDGIPCDLSVGQAIWCPGETGVVFSGWWHEPYRLGLIYCTNRRSGIFYISLDGSGFEQLSKDGEAVLSPRFSPQMDKLVYLARDVQGVHMSCMRLMEIDWKSKTNSVIIDIMDIPRENGCWNVLDVQGDFILASFCSPSQPHRLMMAPIPATGFADWTVIGKICLSVFPLVFCLSVCLHVSEPNIAQDIKWETIKLTHDTEGSNTEYEAVLIQPSVQHVKPQLVVHPHGGPHSVYPSSYMIYYAGLCRLGYAVLAVNYRGSLGFGQKLVESLPGSIGTQDVTEVKFAVDTVLRSGEFNQENVFLMGGSHGGFIAGHLIGQYPGFFRAVVMRNPVINLVSKYKLSRRTPVGFQEADLDFNDELLTDADTYAKLIACSPITHARKIVTPTMLMLGELDLRVPSSQGKELYRTLKARGVEVRLLVYPGDSHPLNKVETESDAFVNISRWFHEHRITV